MSTHRSGTRLTQRFPQHCHHHDVEYVVRAQPDENRGWTIVVDPVTLDIDRDGTVITATVLDALATSTTIPGARFDPAAADTALHAIGYTRTDPWEQRTTSTGPTAITQAVTRPAATHIGTATSAGHLPNLLAVAS